VSLFIHSDCSVTASSLYPQGRLVATSLLWFLIQSAVAQGDNSDQRLLDAVGTIYCEGKIRGSAVHISLPEKSPQDHSVILSAAHIFFDQETGQAYSSCQYRPQNKRLGGVNVQAVSRSQYAVSATDKITQAENDSLFLLLQRRLYQPSLVLSAKGATASSQLTLVAYSADLDRITVSEPCRPQISPQRVSKYLLLHNCRAQGGMSGGPIVDTVNGKIVAIHGGALVFNQQSLNGGLRESRLTLKRHQVEPSAWINQGRIIDHQLMIDLKTFISKNSNH